MDLRGPLEAQDWTIEFEPATRTIRRYCNGKLYSVEVWPVSVWRRAHAAAARVLADNPKE